MVSGSQKHWSNDGSLSWLWSPTVIQGKVLCRRNPTAKGLVLLVFVGGYYLPRCQTFATSFAASPPSTHCPPLQPSTSSLPSSFSWQHRSQHQPRVTFSWFKKKNPLVYLLPSPTTPLPNFSSSKFLSISPSAYKKLAYIILPALHHHHHHNHHHHACHQIPRRFLLPQA